MNININTNDSTVTAVCKGFSIKFDRLQLNRIGKCNCWNDSQFLLAIGEGPVRPSTATARAVLDEIPTDAELLTDEQRWTRVWFTAGKYTIAQMHKMLNLY